MSVMVRLEFGIVPEKWDEALETFEKALPDTRAFDGCERLDTYLDPTNHRVLLIEHWAKPEDQQAYMGWRMETGFLEATGPLMAGDPTIDSWEISDI